MLSRIRWTLASIALVVVVGCAAHTHVVGNGPTKNEIVQARQWYVLWGLVPMNDVNTKVLAGDAADYQIRTETSGLDFVINIFTSYVSITSRTVTVTK